MSHWISGWPVLPLLYPTQSGYADMEPNTLRTVWSLLEFTSFIYSAIICLLIVDLRQNNSISIISWQ